MKCYLYKNGKKVSDYQYSLRELAGMFDVTEETIRKNIGRVFRDEYEFKVANVFQNKVLSPKDKRVMKDWDETMEKIRRKYKK